MKRKDGYIESYMNNFFDGTYYGYPSNDVIDKKRTNKVFSGIMSNKKSFELDDDLINNNGINAAFVIGEGRNTKTIPTYRGGALLPEITVTPNGSYFNDPINGLKYVRSLKKHGGLGHIFDL